jgi:hypothetical protein
MSSDKPLSADFTALAAEAFDLWQDHLSAMSSDPKAKSELMRLLEPSRRMFADWAAMMQTGMHATTGTFAKPPAKAGAAPAGPAPDDGALRIAELARRVAQLEKQLAKLESRSPGAASKAARAPLRSKPRRV